MERVYFCKTLNFWPIMPVRLIAAFAKLSRVRPHFGFLDRDGKTFFVVGGFKYFIGLRLYAVKINFW